MSKTYSPGSKFLHTLALGTTYVAEASFDLERAIYGKGLRTSFESEHVFVSGLARAGTTILMRMLYQTQKFCSLTYRDMPFVLAPNLWAKVSGLSPRHVAPEERAHADGMQVDIDSPEALDEVFWRTFCADSYIRSRNLVTMTDDAEIIDKFRVYIDLILRRYSADRYLSKNNNNVLRLGCIRTAFPNSAILVPFRDPLQHANSLLKQHRHFSTLHSTDPFSRRYMSWLVHHEFGSDHRPFAVSDKDCEDRDPFTIEYWLQQWVSVYSYLLRQSKHESIECLFISYEMLCRETEAMWEALRKRTGLDENARLNVEAVLSHADGLETGDTMLLAKADEIYREMTRLCKSAFLSDVMQG